MLSIFTHESSKQSIVRFSSNRCTRFATIADPPARQPSHVCYLNLHAFNGLHFSGYGCILAPIKRMQASALENAARIAGRGLYRSLVRECRRFPDVRTG